MAKRYTNEVSKKVHSDKEPESLNKVTPRRVQFLNYCYAGMHNCEECVPIGKSET